MTQKTIEVVSSGFFSTVQDLGRKDFVHLGVSPGGAADSLALRMGNRLVANREGAAAIEMTMTGGRFRFLRDVWIAIAGSDCQPMIGQHPMAMWTSYRLTAGEVLACGALSSGIRAYLCVHGGIDVPVVLGSRSSVVGSTWGGLGRALEAGDKLCVGGQSETTPGCRRAGQWLRRLYRHDFQNGDHSVNHDGNRDGNRDNHFCD